MKASGQSISTQSTHIFKQQEITVFLALQAAFQRTATFQFIGLQPTIAISIKTNEQGLDALVVHLSRPQLWRRQHSVRR